MKSNSNEMPECAAIGRWLQNELDVVETYKLGVARLDDASERASACAVMAEHVAHAAELRDLLHALGRTELGPEATAHPCTHERLAMVNLANDRILEALRAGEAKRLAAYEKALAMPSITPLVAKLVERVIDRERHHVKRLASVR